MATDGVTPLDAARVPDKTADDAITGKWKFSEPVGTAGGVNLLRNASFEEWTNGTTVTVPAGGAIAGIPTGWTANGASAVASRDAANLKVGAAAASLQRVVNNAYLSQRIDLLFAMGPIARWQSKRVSLSCWVRATVASRARIAISDGVTVTNSSYHTGGSAFELLTVEKDLAAAATAVEVRLIVDTGDTTAQFDGTMFNWGRPSQEYVPALPLPIELLAPVWNYLFNGDLEIWGAGTAAAPTGWTLTGAGATVAKNTTAGQFRTGLASASLARAGADCYLSEDVVTAFGPVARWQGQWVTLGAWVRAAAAASVKITINDGVGSSSSDLHSGQSVFEWLTVTRFMDPAATKLEIRLEVVGTNTTAQFDAVTVAQGVHLPGPLPPAWQGRKSIVAVAVIPVSQNHSAPVTAFYGVGSGFHATESLVSFRIAFAKYVARRLHCTLDAAPAATGTFTFTLRKAETTDTLLTAQVTDAGRTAQDNVNEIELAAADLLSVKIVSSAGTGIRYPKASFEIEEIP